MSAPSATDPAPDAQVALAASAYWRGWPEIRADLRSSAALVLVLALAGVIAGLLWWWLAPRADFRITDTGPVVIGSPPDELLIADDTVLALILTAFGLVAGAAAWFLRRRRGVATVLALAVGASVMGAVAWQLGELLGAGPSRAELADVGTVVTTALRLGSVPALALGPFAALLAYLVPVVTAHRDDLERTPDPAFIGITSVAGTAPAEGDRTLLDMPPARPAPELS